MDSEGKNDEDSDLRGALTLVSVLKIEQAITALAATALLEILEEGIIGGIAGSDHLDIDLLLVLDVKYYVSMLFVLLYFLVGRLANVGHGHTGCLIEKEERKKNKLKIATLKSARHSRYYYFYVFKGFYSIRFRCSFFPS